MRYFRELRHIWRLRTLRRMERELEREPEWDLVMDDIPIIVDEAAYSLYKRLVPKERVYVDDCFSTTHNRGTVPGLLPPIPDGHVNYSVWVQWRRGAAGWSRTLYYVELGVLED